MDIKKKLQKAHRKMQIENALFVARQLCTGQMEVVHKGKTFRIVRIMARIEAPPPSVTKKKVKKAGVRVRFKRWNEPAVKFTTYRIFGDVPAITNAPLLAFSTLNRALQKVHEMGLR